MGGVSLLAASLVVAALGFGWVNAIKDGVFDVWSAVRGIFVEEMAEPVDGESDVMTDDGAMEKDDDAMMESELDIDGTIEADPEYDDELNDLEAELDALLNESDAELDSLEEEI